MPRDADSPIALTDEARVAGTTRLAVERGDAAQVCDLRPVQRSVAAALGDATEHYLRGWGSANDG